MFNLKPMIMRRITIFQLLLVLILSVAFLTTTSQNQITTSAKLEYQVQAGTPGIPLKKLPSPELASGTMVSEYKPDLTRAILWSQMTPSTDGAIASQDFEAVNDAYDCKGADDFVVTDGPWSVGIVKFIGAYFNGLGPAEGFNIEFYNDGGGIPGSSIVSFPNLPYSAVAAGAGFEFTVYIPTQNFANGHYWISIQARMNFTPNGQFGWQPNNLPQIQYERHWINPGGGFGSGTNWVPGSTVWPTQTSRDLCFQLESIDDCPAPISLYASNISQTEALLGWTSVGPEISWNIEVGLQGFTPGTGNEVGGEYGTGDNPWLAKSLDPGTTYHFYVQAICESRTVSDWAGPFTFTTLCDPVALVDEDFEDVLFPPLCWTRVAGSGNWTRSTAASGYGTGTASAFANFYNISGSNPFDLISPPFNLTQAQVSFDHAYATYGDTYIDVLQILYSTDDGASYQLLVELEGGASGPLATAPPTSSPFVPTSEQWATKNYILPPGTDYVKFRAISDFGNDLYLDNVVIEEYIPAGCPAPIGLTASNFTVDGADLGWTPVGTESAWNVEVGLPGFTPGNNQYVLQVLGTGLNPLTVTGLNDATAYEFYVQADCGVARDLSLWSGPKLFVTKLACPVGSVAELEVCGNDDNGGCNSEPPEFEAITLGTTVCGTGWYNGSNRDTDWFEFTLAVTTNVTWSARAEFPFLIGLIDGNTGCPVTQFIVSATGNPLETKSINSILAPGNYWAFMAPQFATIATCGLNDLYYATLSGVEVLCPPPTNLTASNLTTSTADLGWTPGGTESLWNIEWGLKGFALGTGTLISGVAVNPYTLSGLDAATEYDFYVQADCGEARTLSEWAGPKTFATAVPNDFCIDAIPIDCSTVSINGTTIGATFDNAPTCVTSNTAPGVWYLFTTAVAANVEMDLCSTSPSWDSKLSVYEGDCDALICVTGNDDFCGLLSGVSFLAQPGINYYVLVHGFGTATGNFQLDIACEPLAACPAPIDLTATNITPTSADLNWTEIGSATLWNLEWGEAGFTLGAGTLVTGIDTKPYPLTGLDPNTEYEFYVQADCGDDARTLSEWAGPKSFKTLCGAFDLPFGEDFTGIPGQGFPDCWSTTALGAENWFVVESNAAGGEVPEMLLIWGSPSFDGTSRLITPILNTGGATDLKISLNQFLDDWPDNEGDYIAIEYSVDGGNSWVEIWQFVTDTDYGPAFDEFEFSIPEASDELMIAFTFVGNSFNIDGWYIDDVMIVVNEPEVPENRNIDGVANLNDCYDASNTITVTNSTVPNGSSAYFKAGVNIIFGDGFVVESGAYMHAEITTVYCNPPALLSVLEEAPAVVLPEIKEPASLFRVYPNPTQGLFKLELLGDGDITDVDVEIYNMMGERVYQDRLFGSMLYEFNLNNMPRGIYFIRVMRGSETGLEKVIRQ